MFVCIQYVFFVWLCLYLPTQIFELQWLFRHLHMKAVFLQGPALCWWAVNIFFPFTMWAKWYKREISFSESYPQKWLSRKSGVCTCVCVGLSVCMCVCLCVCEYYIFAVFSVEGWSLVSMPSWVHLGVVKLGEYLNYGL